LKPRIEARTLWYECPKCKGNLLIWGELEDGDAFCCNRCEIKYRVSLHFRAEPYTEEEKELARKPPVTDYLEKELAVNNGITEESDEANKQR